jgi:hypothetical protein
MTWREEFKKTVEKMTGWQRPSGEQLGALVTPMRPRRGM